MFDEKGNKIDLDLIDAVGKLPDGRAEIWLSDGSRVFTVHPSAFDIWMRHVRSKSADPDPSLAVDRDIFQRT